MWAHRDVGGYVASEASTVVAGRGYKPSTKRPIIFFTGGTNDRDFLTTAASGSAIPPGIVECGAPIISADFGGGNQYGNDTSQTRIGQLWAYVKTLMGTPTDKFVGIGVSQGATALLNYTRNNPSNVAALVGIVPGVNLTNVYADNAGSQTAIDAAYTDHTGFLAGLATHDPALNTATHLSQAIPMKLYDGSADTVVRPADVTGFATAIGATSRIISGTDHLTTAPALVPTADILSFIGPYL